MFIIIGELGGSEKQGLISQGKKRASGSRSAALRYILDQIRLKSN